MEYGYAKYIPVFKAPADETRLKIPGTLSGGALCACKTPEQFSITQPTLSYHKDAYRMRARHCPARRRGNTLQHLRGAHRNSRYI